MKLNIFSTTNLKLHLQICDIAVLILTHLEMTKLIWELVSSSAFVIIIMLMEIIIILMSIIYWAAVISFWKYSMHDNDTMHDNCLATVLSSSSSLSSPSSSSPSSSSSQTRVWRELPADLILYLENWFPKLLPQTQTQTLESTHHHHHHHHH